jgi:hypothetical protein
MRNPSPKHLGQDPSDAVRKAPSTKGIGRKLASLAGAAGAAVLTGEAEAVTYVPTAGVAPAQNIPGFVFVDSSNVTLGALRPPSSPGITDWDVDGNADVDFELGFVSATNISASLVGVNSLAPLLGQGPGDVLGNLADGTTVGSLAPSPYSWKSTRFVLSASGAMGAGAAEFTQDVSGQFGFQFYDGGDVHYGWGSVVVDLTVQGQGFKITEAYYNTTSGLPIAVGAVPVPEPSGAALLALGAAGVAAWKRRRGQ